MGPIEKIPKFEGLKFDIPKKKKMFDKDKKNNSNKKSNELFSKYLEQETEKLKVDEQEEK